MDPKLILVTGATGYVGTVLVPILAKSFRVRTFDTETFGNELQSLGDQNIECVRGDILDFDALWKATRGAWGVVHLAGIVTDELVDMNHVKAMRVNLLGTEHVARAAHWAGVERLIYASSSSVYGSQDQICTETTTTRPQTVYAATKLVGEDIILGYMKELTVCCLRCATCCGPAPRMRLDTIVNIFSAQAYFDGIISVHGGGQYRTNVHVKDVAETYKALLEADGGLINGQVYNLTAGNHTALDLGRLVADITGARLTVDETKQDRRSYRMSADRIRREIAGIPQRTIEDAVRENLWWFASGHIKDWKSDLYYNTRRMEGVMRGAQ